MDMKAVSFFMLTMAAAWMLACSGTEAKYDITGKNAPRDGAKVALVDRRIEDDIDSAVVVDGAFHMKGKAAKDAFLGIVVEDYEWNFPLINDGVPMVIDFADSSLTGSALNTKLTECDKRNGREYARLNQLVRDYMALPKEERVAGEDAFVAEYDKVFNQFVDNIGINSCETDFLQLLLEHIDEMCIENSIH